MSHRTKRPSAWEARLLNELRNTMDNMLDTMTHPDFSPFAQPIEHSYYSPTFGVTVTVRVEPEEPKS